MLARILRTREAEGLKNESKHEYLDRRIHLRYEDALSALLDFFDRQTHSRVYLARLMM